MTSQLLVHVLDYSFKLIDGLIILLDLFFELFDALRSAP